MSMPIVFGRFYENGWPLNAATTDVLPTAEGPTIITLNVCWGIFDKFYCRSYKIVLFIFDYLAMNVFVHRGQAMSLLVHMPHIVWPQSIFIGFL